MAPHGRADFGGQLDRDLGGTHLLAILLGEVTAEGEGRVLEALVGHHVMHQAHDEGAVGIGLLIAHDQPARPVRAADAGQSADPVGGRQHAEQPFGEGEGGRFGRQAEIAGQRHFQPAADAGGVDGADDRLFHMLHLVIDALHPVELEPVIFADAAGRAGIVPGRPAALHVRAGTEIAAGRSD